MVLDKTHAIILAAALAVSGVVGYEIVDKIEQHDHDAAVLAAQQLASAKDSNAQLSQLVAQQTQLLEKQRQDLDSRDRLLAQENQTLQKVLDAQKAKDAQLSPTDLSSRWASLINLPASVAVEANGDFAVTPEGAVATVQALDERDSLKAEVANDEQQLADKTQVIEGLDKTVDLQKQEITSDKTVLATQIDADKKELTAVKAQARKSKIKWFFAGVVAGFLGRSITLK